MAKAPRQPESDLVVNEYEGAVLGLIARSQPVTRYRLFKAFEQSPTTSVNTSKGSLYPLIGRMIDRGFVEAETGTNRRASEMLKLTPLGHAALAQWIGGTGPQHSFAHDPLLVRVLSLGDVPREERIRWIADAKALLLQKKTELEEYRKAVDAPYMEIVHGTAVAVVNAKLEWLDRLLIKVVAEKDRG